MEYSYCIFSGLNIWHYFDGPFKHILRPLKTLTSNDLGMLGGWNWIFLIHFHDYILFCAVLFYVIKIKNIIECKCGSLSVKDCESSKWLNWLNSILKFLNPPKPFLRERLLYTCLVSVCSFFCVSSFMTHDATSLREHKGLSQLGRTGKWIKESCKSSM